MIIDIEKVSVDEEAIRSIGREYIQRVNHWYSWFWHRNHRVAIDLRDNPLPKTGFDRLVYLALKLTILPNHSGILASLIKAVIQTVLGTRDPDAYLHVLLQHGLDVSRLNQIGQAYTNKHGNKRPGWVKRLLHGHQDAAYKLAIHRGHHNSARNWVVLAETYESLNPGELSRAIDAEFMQHFGLPPKAVIKRLNLLTYCEYAEIHELQTMVHRGEVSTEREAEVSSKLEKALRRTLPNQTELPATSSMMVSIATLPPAVVVSMGVGAVGAGTGLVMIGTLFFTGGTSLPIMLAVGACAFLVSSAVVGTNLFVANQSGRAVKIRENDLIAFRAASETLLTQYVAIFMRLSKDIAHLDEISKELTETKSSLRTTAEELTHATRRIEELEQLEVRLREDIKTLGTTIATLTSNTEKQAGITLELSEHSKQFEEALKGIQIARAEFERMRNEYQRLIERHESLIDRQESLSSNPHGFLKGKSDVGVNGQAIRGNELRY